MCLFLLLKIILGNADTLRSLLIRFSLKGFERKNQLFSLCGLNCGLCPMLLGNHCGGCGNGNQSCRIAKCSLAHGGIAYCFQCQEYILYRYVHTLCCLFRRHAAVYKSFANGLHIFAHFNNMPVRVIETNHTLGGMGLRP